MQRRQSAGSIGAESQDETDWQRVRKLTTAQIRAAIAADPDAAPELDETFWKNARVVMPDNKVSMTVRLDSDVLTWFRSLGKGYQTRINAVLRSYMKAHGKVS